MGECSVIRVFDLFISLLGLICLSPIFLPIALLLKLTGEGEVFYIQKRIGKGEQAFGLFKFATMLKNSPNMGAGHITVKGDPRVLPVGAFLRKTKINELPQLLNILRGDMSFIGPRPLTEDAYAKYSTEVRAALSQMRPGLSGVGSIVFRDEESLIGDGADAQKIYAEHIAPYKGDVEVWFVKHRSVGLYCVLFFLTVWVVLVPRSRLIWRVLPSLPKPPDLLGI